MLGHPAAGLAAGIKCQAFKQTLQGDGTSAVAEGEPVDLFEKGPLRAVGVAAGETADQQVDRRDLCPDSRIGESSYVSAMHTLRHGPAHRAQGVRLTAPCRDPVGPTHPDHGVDCDLGQMRK
jgi:hypothetical protein